ncbi:hypothetical protein GCM10027276_28130 [Comamonas piscis]
MTQRRHVFISHHHADDQKVSGLTSMLSRAGYDVRNSSIRAKPANQRLLDQGRISDRVIARLLRMKMSWATTVVVLIGRETHTRPWVNWEINKAQELGKRIVGVYERGGTENDLPESFKKYGDALVAWNSDSVIDAIDAKVDPFQNPDGTPRQPLNIAPRNNC